MSIPKIKFIEIEATDGIAALDAAMTASWARLSGPLVRLTREQGKAAIARMRASRGTPDTTLWVIFENGVCAGYYCDGNETGYATKGMDRHIVARQLTVSEVLYPM